MRLWVVVVGEGGEAIHSVFFFGGGGRDGEWAWKGAYRERRMGHLSTEW